MNEDIIVTLTRPAKSQGGDRYEAVIEGESHPFIVYIPQKISRAGDGKPAAQLTLTITKE